MVGLVAANCAAGVQQRRERGVILIDLLRWWAKGVCKHHPVCPLLHGLPTLLAGIVLDQFPAKLKEGVAKGSSRRPVSDWRG